jgi:hypothetical protein
MSRAASLSLSLLLLFAGAVVMSLNGCGASKSPSTIRPGKLQHIVVIFQENRTPDNLFQNATLKAAGADIVNPSPGGLCTPPHGNSFYVPLTNRPLADCYGPSHDHNTAWVPMYDNGQMDGACNIPLVHRCTGEPTYPRTRSSTTPPDR